MKEMFSKIISFLIGFCSKLFGKDKERKESCANLNIHVEGGIKMINICTSKEQITTMLSNSSWDNLIIQDVSCQHSKRYVAPSDPAKHQEAVEKFVNLMEVYDTLLILRGEDYDSVILMPNSEDQKKIDEAIHSNEEVDHNA